MTTVEINLDSADDVVRVWELMERNRIESDPKAKHEILSEWAKDVTPGKPEWLWNDWIAKKALNLLIGRQGSGKTTFATWLVGVVTTGLVRPLDPIPYGLYNCGVLSLEEPKDRIVARLHAAGADLTRVLILENVQDIDDEGKPFHRRWSLPKDINVLADKIIENDLALVVIDGLGYSISGDSHNYAIVGTALSALGDMAQRTGAAILGLVHPPKGNSEAVTAAIGSTAWTALPRIAMVLGFDPNDESGERRVVAVSKSNYRYPDSSLEFKIGTDKEFEVGFVHGMNSTTITADEITSPISTREEKGERAEAREFLRSILKDGEIVDAGEVGPISGFNAKTLQRARKDVGVVATARRNDHGRVVGWNWSLPQPEGQS